MDNKVSPDQVNKRNGKQENKTMKEILHKIPTSKNEITNSKNEQPMSKSDSNTVGETSIPSTSSSDFSIESASNQQLLTVKDDSLKAIPEKCVEVKRTSNSEDNKTANSEDNKTANREDNEIANRQDNKTANRKDNKTAISEDNKTASREDNKTVNREDNKTANREDNQTASIEAKQTVRSDMNEIVSSVTKQTARSENKKTASTEIKQPADNETKRTSSIETFQTSSSAASETTSTEEEKTQILQSKNKENNSTTSKETLTDGGTPKNKTPITILPNKSKSKKAAVEQTLTKVITDAKFKTENQQEELTKVKTTKCKQVFKNSRLWDAEEKEANCPIIIKLIGSIPTRSKEFFYVQEFFEDLKQFLKETGKTNIVE